MASVPNTIFSGSRLPMRITHVDAVQPVTLIGQDNNDRQHQADFAPLPEIEGEFSTVSELQETRTRVQTAQRSVADAYDLDEDGLKTLGQIVDIRV